MRILTGLFLLTAVLITSCGEDFSGTIEEGDISNFKRLLEEPIQSFRIDATSGGRIVTPQNTILSFEPNSFVY